MCFAGTAANREGFIPFRDFVYLLSVKGSDNSRIFGLTRGAGLQCTAANREDYTGLRDYGYLLGVKGSDNSRFIGLQGGAGMQRAPPARLQTGKASSRRTASCRVRPVQQ